MKTGMKTRYACIWKLLEVLNKKVMWSNSFTETQAVVQKVEEQKVNSSKKTSEEAVNKNLSDVNYLNQSS